MITQNELIRVDEGGVTYCKISIFPALFDIEEAALIKELTSREFIEYVSEEFSEDDVRNFLETDLPDIFIPWIFEYYVIVKKNQRSKGIYRRFIHNGFAIFSQAITKN